MSCHSTAKCFVYTLKGSIAPSVASSWLFHNKLRSTVSWWCEVGGVCCRGDAILKHARNCPVRKLKPQARYLEEDTESWVIIEKREEDDNSQRMSRVISLPALIGQQGPICSQRIQAGSCVAWSLKVSWISAAQLHFLAGGFGIIFNFPRLTTNMKLSVLVKQRRLNRATCSVFRSVATSCWHISKAGGCECNTFCPPEGRQGCLLGRGGGHRAPVFHHLPIHHNVTQVPACQDSVCFTRCESGLNFQGS